MRFGCRHHGWESDYEPCRSCAADERRAESERASAERAAARRHGELIDAVASPTPPGAPPVDVGSARAATVRMHLQTARRCLDARDAPAAQAQLDLAYAADPSDPAVHDAMAGMRAAAGDAPGALRALALAWRHGPTVARGVAWAARESVVDRAFQEVVDRLPHSEEPRRAWAAAHLEAGQPEAAVVALGPTPTPWLLGEIRALAKERGIEISALLMPVERLLAERQRIEREAAAELDRAEARATSQALDEARRRRDAESSERRRDDRARLRHRWVRRIAALTSVVGGGGAAWAVGAFVAGIGRDSSLDNTSPVLFAALLLTPPAVIWWVGLFFGVMTATQGRLTLRHVLVSPVLVSFSWFLIGAAVLLCGSPVAFLMYVAGDKDDAALEFFQAAVTLVTLAALTTATALRAFRAGGPDE